MINICINFCRRNLVLAVFVGVVTPAAFAAPVTLQDVENAALVQAPEIQSWQAKAKGLKAASVAAGQLADPKLMLGAANVPVDTFSFEQEGMTQVQFGLQQAFPRGRSLHYGALKQENLSAAAAQQQKNWQLKVLQGVRSAWVNLYAALQSQQFLLEQKKVLQNLVRVTESMVANNKAQQYNLVGAQLELSGVEDRLLQNQQAIMTARSQLARWTGSDLAQKAHPHKLPKWTAPPALSQLEKKLEHHPALQVDTDTVAAARADVDVAKQQYKPGFMMGVTYGARQGDGRPDFLSGQVTMDLPLFTGNRQDQSLQASQEQLTASEADRLSNYRQLRETLITQYSTWQQRTKSVRLYQLNLLPQAKQYAESTMSAYQNAQIDFPTVAAASIRVLDTELLELKSEVEMTTARINLLYFEG